MFFYFDDKSLQLMKVKNNGEHCWLGNGTEVNHWGSLLNGVAVQGVLYQSILHAKFTGRKKLGRKRCTSNRDERKLENTVKQSQFKHFWASQASQGVNWSWSQCIKSHHTQTSSGKELPSHFWNRNIVRSILPGLRRKRTGLLISGPKSSFQMKVHLAFHLEIKVPESGGRVARHRIHVAWSPVWSFHSQWWFGLPCHLLVLVHCVSWSPQSTQPSTRKF